MITPDGKTALRQYFAGYKKSIADTLAIGLGNAAGNKMQCEWFRMPVVLVGSNTDSSEIVFKGSSDLPFAGTVYEVALLQGPGGLSTDTILTSFMSSEEGWSGDFTFDAAGVRLDKGLKVQANKTSSCYKNLLNINQYNEQDKLVLAANAAGVCTVKVTLEFNNGSSALFNLSLAAGYNIVKVDRSTAVKTGMVDWTNLSKITVNPTLDVTFDFLKFEQLSPYDELVVARTILTTPKVVNTSLPLEIEYPLGINIA